MQNLAWLIFFPLSFLTLECLGETNRMPEAVTEVACVGSSSIARWPKNMEPPFNCLKRLGMEGAPIGKLYENIDKFILENNPKIFILYTGENDIAGGIPIKKIDRNYRELVNLILDKHNTDRLILLPIKTSPSRSAHHALFSEFNRTQLEIAATDCRIVIAHTPKLNANPPDARYFTPDGIHLSREGYEVWRDALAEAVAVNICHHD